MTNNIMREYMNRLDEAANPGDYQLYADTNGEYWYIPERHKDTIINAMILSTGSTSYAYLDPANETTPEESGAQPIPIEELEELEQLMQQDEEENPDYEEEIARKFEDIADYVGGA